MVDATVRYGRDTWAGSGKPAVNHNGAARLKLLSGSARAFVYLKTPVPPGMTVVSAKLQVFASNTSKWTGTKTLTARRIGDSWKAGKLTWNNQPGVTGSYQPTLAVSNATDGQLLEIDVTPHLQTVANGDPHYGWRITTDSSADHWLYGFDSPNPPRLVVTYADDPSAPTDLSPQGGAVSIAKPILSFSATDLANPGEIQSLQVQIDPAASTSAPGFDSGEVTSTVPELDLSTTSYAGLADGASTQWRARVKSADAVWSEWSDWVTFNRDSKGTVAITNPAASPNNYVAESTPPIIWTFSGETQSAYRVQIVDPTDPTTILADSDEIDGTDTSWSIPAGVIHDGQSYRAIVHVWDTKDRVATPGDRRYAEAVQDFTFSEDVSVPAPGSLIASPNADGFGIALSWVRATAPDSWTILRDGKNIASDVDPADTLTSGSSYAWTDADAKPGRSHSYAVRAVVNGRASSKSNTATATAQPVGLWLVDNIAGTAAQIFDDEVSMSGVDQAGNYRVIGSRRQVRIVTGMSGLEGSVAGNLIEEAGQDVDAAEDALNGMKSHPDRTFRLVAHDMSIPVEVGNVNVFTADSYRGRRIKAVRFDFWQVAEFAFKGS